VADVGVVARGSTSPEPLTASANDWTWAPIAAVNAVSPQGVAQGATVTVTGRSFTAGMTVQIQVDAVGTVSDVTSTVTVVSPTTFTFVAPARAAGQTWKGNKPLVVRNSSGALSTVDPGGSNVFTWG
jgi:hypothetical protein